MTLEDLINKCIEKYNKSEEIIDEGYSPIMVTMAEAEKSILEWIIDDLKKIRENKNET